MQTRSKPGEVLRFIKLRLGLIGLFWLVFGGAPLFAQGIPALPEPAELPPGDYTETEYVDSAGCVFNRVGRGDATVWAIRLDANRTPVCGREPSLTTAVTTSAPMHTARPRGVTTPRPRRIRRPSIAGISQTTTHRTPQGFVAAWNDDRLNPYRARGTADGEAQMNRLWSQTVPRVLLHGDQAGQDTRIGTLRYVDAGSYRNPENARRVLHHLRRGGYPVEVRLKHRRQTIFTGPFDSARDQQLALSYLHSSGIIEAKAVERSAQANR